jgi:hypothetical protein
MEKDKWRGIGFIFFGLFFFRWTIKNWVKGTDIFNSNLISLIGAIGAIIGGFAFLLGQVHW